MAGRLPIELTFDRVACQLHGEPFRATWPNGWPVFAVFLLKHLVNTGFAHAPVPDVEAKLDELPACCRVPDDVLLEAYAHSGIGSLLCCTNCETIALGAPFSFAKGGREVTLDHLCFDCVVHAVMRLN